MHACIVHTIGPHRMREMRTIAIDVHGVCKSVSVSVTRFHAVLLCKNSWMDQSLVWGKDSWWPKTHPNLPRWGGGESMRPPPYFDHLLEIACVCGWKVIALVWRHRLTNIAYLHTGLGGPWKHIKITTEDVYGIAVVQCFVVCSTNCMDDYLAVYDGMTSSRPLISRFCGQTAAHLISSGSSMFIVFHSGLHRTPSFNHSGFSLQILDRWKSKQQPD